MKNVTIALGIVLVVVGTLTALPCGRYVVAVTGCCKERPTEDHAWRRSAMTFEQCVDANQVRDGGGEIFEPNGTVWWDIGC